MNNLKIIVRSGLISVALFSWGTYAGNLSQESFRRLNLWLDSAMLRKNVCRQQTGLFLEGATTLPEIVARAAGQSVVLLGETHVNREHHRWQLQMLAALHAVRPDMVIGFEMFPRRVQKVLDQWVAGELSESAFLRAAEWDMVWRTDASLYLPLFHFARMNRIPMQALNIDTRLRKQVSKRF